MAVRSAVIAKGMLAAAPAGGRITTIRACPAGMTIIVKSIFLHNPDAQHTPMVHLRTSQGDHGGIWAPVLVQNVPQYHGAWFVMEPGDILDVVQGASAGRVAYRVSGAELDGVAP